MAEEVDYEIKVDTKGVDKAENAVSKLANKTKQAFSGVGDKLKDVGDKIGRAHV